MNEKKELWDITIYPTDNVLENSSYYMKCLSEIFKVEPVISYQMLNFQEKKAIPQIYGGTL